jgi:hypothetical protein
LNFSPHQALDYARSIAKPRRIGSEGERAAALEITNLLRGFGYIVEKQPFQFIAALHGWIRLELILGSLLILAMMTRSIAAWAPILPAILLISIVFLANPLHRWVQASSLHMGDPSTHPSRDRFLSRLGPLFKSANIVASLPYDSRDDPIPKLYLVAHYDSKSQTLPLPIRIALFALYILAGLSTSTITILSLFFPELGPIIPYFVCVSLLFGIPLIFMSVGNVSPGAIDNASGVGLILHLAELLAADRNLLQSLHVTLLFTTAEEEGLMGAQAYVAMNEPTLQRQAQKGGVYILNFDGIGTQGKLLLNGISQKPEKDSEGCLFPQAASRPLEPSWIMPPLPNVDMKPSPCRPGARLPGMSIRSVIPLINYTQLALNGQAALHLR